MTKEETLFYVIGDALEPGGKSQMFGIPCYKTGGKAFISFYKQDMVFKLDKDFHEEAIGLKGACKFDPSGMGRPMKEWVQVPPQYKDRWPRYAEAALKKVKADLGKP